MVIDMEKEHINLIMDIIYNGDWVDGDRNGWGTMQYTNGFYEGEWKNNNREGKGKMTWTQHPNKGDVYDGEWKDDTMHGKGIYQFHNGRWYNGDWVDGDMYGWGTLKDYDGIYEGEFKHDKKDGKGKMKYNKPWEGVYEGQWKDDKKHGRGVLIRYDERIEDVWEDDKRNIPTKKFKVKAGRFRDKNGIYTVRVDSDGKMYDQYGNRK